MEKQDRTDELAPTPTRQFVAYDRETGAITGTAVYMYFGGDVEEPGREEILGALGADEEQAERTELLPVEPGHEHANARFDHEAGELVPLFHLRVEPKRAELEGNGEDGTAISVSVVDSEGRLVNDFEGELTVTTTRGRLSERGGRVVAKNGQATLELTSVAETVAQVVVGARDPSGRSLPGASTVEFL
jgi:hypothetical protein